MISWVHVQVFVKQTHEPGQGSFAAWVPWVPVRPSIECRKHFAMSRPHPCDTSLLEQGVP